MSSRLDQLLVERGLCDSREQAKRLIIAGEVKVGGHFAAKPAVKVAEDAEIEIREKPPYVGRGGFKLAGALDAFGVDPSGMTCFDAGASTGGFTDCLLQRGAAKVFAFDVGTNQLAWKIRNDPRVVARERFNIRHMKPEDVGEEVDLAVGDLSFISLTLVLPAVFSVMREGAEMVVLVKPQFELGREEVGKGGIVREEALREKAVRKVKDFVEGNLGKEWKDVVPSSISGTDGNQEYLAWIKNSRP